MKKVFLILLTAMLASTTSAQTSDELDDILLRTELPFRGDMKINPKASETDLGKLSKAVLGQLYAYVESIDHVNDTSANVKAHIGTVACEMYFVRKEYVPPVTSEDSVVWQLDKLECK